MKYKNLGKTDIKVSLIGLGTMTWGQQNDKHEAFEQMSYALSRGVNFFDAAEFFNAAKFFDTAKFFDAANFF